MKTRISQIFISVCIGFLFLQLFTACSSMYIPAVRSIPLLENKDEFQGEAGISTNSVYINGSYAFSDDIAVSINGSLSFRNFTNHYDLFTHKDDQGPHGGFWGTPPDTRGKFAHRYGDVSIDDDKFWHTFIHFSIGINFSIAPPCRR